MIRKFDIDLGVLLIILFYVLSNWHWSTREVIGFIWAGVFFSMWVLGEQGRAPSLKVNIDGIKLEELHLYLNQNHASTIYLGLSMLGLVVAVNFFYIYLAWFAWILFKVRGIQVREHIYVEEAHGHDSHH